MIQKLSVKIEQESQITVKLYIKTVFWNQTETSQIWNGNKESMWMLKSKNIPN